MFARRKDISNISLNIKAYRLGHNMKQTEMADLLEMNYQNYSKMERGVYTPSLEKFLDICDILVLKPNDLLLEGKDYDEFKQEVFESLDLNVLSIIDMMKCVEEERAQAKMAKAKMDEKSERFYLDKIISMFAWTNEHMWEVADYLYFKAIDKYIKNTSDNLVEESRKLISIEKYFDSSKSNSEEEKSN